MASHSCNDSDGTYCGTCTGSFTDSSCCSVFVETYRPPNGGLSRTSCISSNVSNPKLGDGIEIGVTTMAGADGSKTTENAGERIFGRVLIPFMLLGVAIYVSIKVLEKSLQTKI